MSLKNDVLNYIKLYPGTTDSEIAKHFGKIHQHINQTCHLLESQGLIKREQNYEKNNYIGNYPVDKNLLYDRTTFISDTYSTSDSHLQEDEVKHYLKIYLEENNWSIEKFADKNKHGVDIEAKRDGEKWLIEVKGCGSRQPMRNNYFISVLGEILQRMNDSNARYSIAFPDMKQYRNLWNKLPNIAKERTTIDMLLVDSKGNVKEFK